MNRFIKEMDMSKITIDNIEYSLDSLSNDAKAQLMSMQFCDSEIARLQAQLAVIQTARVSYARSLKDALPNLEGDTVKVS